MVPRLIAEISTLNEAKAAVEGGADEIILNRGYADREELGICSQYLSSVKKRLIISIPPVMSDEELTSTLNTLGSLNIQAVSVSNIGAVSAAVKAFETCADFGMNIFNSKTLKLLKEAEIKRAGLSPELNLKEVRGLVRKAGQIGIEAECLVHGDIQIMVSKQCLPYNLSGKEACKGCPEEFFSIRDHRGYVFPVRRGAGCLNYTYNSRELCTLQNIRDILGAGVMNWRFSLSFKEPGYIIRVLKAYKEAHKLSAAELKNIKKQLEDMSPMKFTKGHYYRGVE